MNILFIDDIEQPRKWLDKDNSITIAKDYSNAIENIRKQRYDLIDIKLDLTGVNSGYDILRHIINNNIKINSIYLHSGDAETRSKLIKRIRENTSANIQYY